jgi:hypothetical protein
MATEELTDPASLNSIVDKTDSGDKIIFNDRSKPLTRVGTHERNRKKTNRDKPKDTVELEGNGTTYHLLQTETDTHDPMLYKETDWEETPDDPYHPYEYPRMGEQVENATILRE